jgi:hypothetical protein
MTVKYVRFIEGAILTTTIATYYTAPAGTKAVIKKLTFCNNNSDPVSIAVFLVPAGGSVDPKNLLVVQQPLAPAETFDCFAALLHVLEPGDSLQAIASVENAINIMASGIEIQ